MYVESCYDPSTAKGPHIEPLVHIMTKSSVWNLVIECACKFYNGQTMAFLDVWWLCAAEQGKCQ